MELEVNIGGRGDCMECYESIQRYKERIIKGYASFTVIVEPTTSWLLGRHTYIHTDEQMALDVHVYICVPRYHPLI